MSRTLIPIIISILLFSSCNEAGSEKKSRKTLGESYSLPFPPGWETELFSIPISFAPEIAYKGIEDIRFAPGWGKSGSKEYWSYAFLWCLENKPVIDAKTIEENLQLYYSGLLQSNAQKYKLPAEKITAVKTTIEKTTTLAGDAATFNGSVAMIDYMKQEPITLNCIIHLKYCAGNNNTFLFHEISPQPFTDSTWENLHKLWRAFECR